MIAAVDGRAERAIVIRPAPSTGLRGRLVLHDLRTAPLQLHRSGQAGEARADHVDELRHQKKAYLATIHSRRARGLLTFVRGRSKPRSTVRSRRQR